MPYLDSKYGKVYYEEYGSGDPIIFLNGVAMTSKSWLQFIGDVTRQNKMIVFDFIDQGKTEAFKEGYSLDDQSELLLRLMDELKIEKAHMLGMSYGGKVLLNFTKKNLSRIKSMTLVNTAHYRSNYNESLVKSWINAGSYLDGKLFSQVLLTSMYSIHYFEKFPEKINQKEDYFINRLDKVWYERFVRNIYSTRGYDSGLKLENINIPTLVVSSQDDYVIPLYTQEEMHRAIEASKIKIIPEVGHAIMYEKPKEFIDVSLNFIRYGI